MLKNNNKKILREEDLHGSDFLQVAIRTNPSAFNPK